MVMVIMMMAEIIIENCDGNCDNNQYDRDCDKRTMVRMRIMIMTEATAMMIMVMFAKNLTMILMKMRRNHLASPFLCQDHSLFHLPLHLQPLFPWLLASAAVSFQQPSFSFGQLLPFHLPEFATSSSAAWQRSIHSSTCFLLDAFSSSPLHFWHSCSQTYSE